MITEDVAVKEVAPTRIAELTASHGLQDLGPGHSAALPGTAPPP